MMKPESVAILRSPQSHEPLRLESKTEPDGTVAAALVSIPSGERYPMRDGIPVLLDQSTVTGSNLRYQRAYDRAARLYDPAIGLVAALAGGNERRFRWGYLERLGIHAGQRVLEVSVGTGANLRCLPRGPEYHALDISWGMLTRCRANLARWAFEAELYQGNAQALPFRDETFDVVFHVGGINAFEDRALALSEMLRVARTGARLLVVDETAKAMEALSWFPGVRKVLEEYSGRFEAPVELLPDSARGVEAVPIVKGWLYCLTCVKD